MIRGRLLTPVLIVFWLCGAVSAGPRPASHCTSSMATRSGSGSKSGCSRSLRRNSLIRRLSISMSESVMINSGLTTYPVGSCEFVDRFSS